MKRDKDVRRRQFPLLTSRHNETVCDLLPGYNEAKLTCGDVACFSFTRVCAFEGPVVLNLRFI